MNRPISRGQSQQAAQNVIDVQLQTRLMSQSGIPSSKSKTSQRRVVKDKLYYESAVRNQNQQLGKEIDAIQAEIQRLEQVGQAVVQLQQKNQEMQVTNKNLANSIADSNATLNLINQAKNIQEFTQEVTSVEQQVLQLRNDANVAYKAEQEAKNDWIQNQKKSISLQNAIKQRIGADLGDSAADEYQTLINENKDMIQQIEELNQQLEKASHELNEAFSASFINENEFVGKAVELKKQIGKYQRQYNQLQQQLLQQSSSANQGLTFELKRKINQIVQNCKQLNQEIKTQESAIQKRRELFEDVAQTNEFVILNNDQRQIIKTVLKAERMVSQWPKQKVELTAQMQQIAEQVEEATAALVSIKKTNTTGIIDVETQLHEKTKELEKLTAQQEKLLSDLVDINNELLQQSDRLQAMQSALQDCQKIENKEEIEKNLNQTMQDEQEKNKKYVQQKQGLEQQLKQLQDETAKDDKFNAADLANKNLQMSKFKLYDQERKLKDQENQTQFKEEQNQAVNLLGQLQKELSNIDKE